jgi:PAS domain S-box-containing protein
MRKPLQEYERLARLRALNVLDPASDSTFDSLVQLAAQSAAVRGAFLSFMESDRQIIRAQHGVSLADIPREFSPCSRVIQRAEPVIISDLSATSSHADIRLHSSLSSIRFYASFPLVSRDEVVLGTLCVIDTQPCDLSDAQIAVLNNLARHVVSHLELHNKLSAVQRTISSLEDSEERFRKIADASPVLLWIADNAGNRTLSNKAWCDFTGLSEEASLAESWTRTLHPDDVDVYNAKRRECAAAGAPFRHEFRLRHVSGSYRWVMEQAIPLFSSTGNLEAYVSSCVDLSLRNSDELQYQHNEARFRAVSEAAPLGIVVTDSRGHCIYANHQFQRLSGLTAEESLGSGWLRTTHPEDRRRIEAAWHTATQSTMQFENTFRYQHQDGTITWTSLKAAAINATDTVSGWVLTLEDITAKRDAEAELVAAKQSAENAMHAKSQFLANMSHEIRTPLTAILGFVDALRDEGPHNQTQLHCLDVIRTNGEHLLNVINQILDLSKIDAGALTIETAPCNIVQTIEEIRFMFAPTIAEKSLSFSVHYEWPLPRRVTTDPLRLKQVLINIVGNAIKFTERGTIDLRIGWNDAQKQLLFEVSDTGIGMSAEQTKNLFKPFSQGNESITRRYGGTGLGLSISERLVRAMGGSMNVRSVPGQGSTFSFFIQSAGTSSTLIRKVPNPRATPKPGAASPLPLFRGRVLFADDALDNRRLVEHLLRKAGVEVVLVEDGHQAIESVRSSHFDLILMDVQMPTIDGLTATTRIRKSGVATPIVALSAGAMTSEVEMAMQAGCSMHLSKPFSRDAFYQMLSKYLTPSVTGVIPNPQPPLHSSLEGNDPEMLPLLIEFIEGLPNRLRDLQSAADHADTTQIALLAHKLKGSAGMYGFPELSIVAGKFEAAAKKDDRAEYSNYVQQLFSILERIQVACPGRNAGDASKADDAHY